AYVPKSMFYEAISSCRLVQMLEPYWVSGNSSWIVYQNLHFLPLRARLAIGFLLDHFVDWQE
ncbi:LysR family transcriptional regulator, partial [Vibrio sp. 2-2(9)]|nr:LysR family transcriptional regulator [Vibrio sp. 2-2(9)]